ncbi:MAG TPA: lipoxygenase family protein [Solirubrobacteraceae bacterium]|nr:lipoxygenase family protein [Solirubrobacteraceae bacterium]
MGEGTSPQGQARDAGGLRRRAFIGTGLAGAGAALISPTTSSATKTPSAPTDHTDDGSPTAVPPIGQLPLQALYPNLPAIPVDAGEALQTLSKLSTRSQQTAQAKQGLTRRITIGGVTRTAYALLFEPGAVGSRPLQLDELRTLLSDGSHATLPQRYMRRLREQDRVRPAARTSGPPPSLEAPQQFALSWTTMPDVAQQGAALLPEWSASLTDPSAATAQFWPMIAQHGLAFNLLLPERVRPARAPALRRMFGSAWQRELQAPFARGELYVIDMSRFTSLTPQSVNGSVRFTPATVTALVRDPQTKTLTPVAISVTGPGGTRSTVFTAARSSDGAWLYALQAAKTSITVFGIWLGHVYQWHLVTAAMLMTMINALPSTHPISVMMAPHSGSLIGFDDVLLQAWSQIGPPTSVSSATQFLSLADDFAAGRSYFDDDPAATLRSLGLRRRDFTSNTPWDRYPVAAQTLEVWDLVAEYVGSIVRASYPSDAAVSADAALQAWIQTAAAPTTGNVRGLRAPRSRAALERILTSLLYRITVHGSSRMFSASNPSHTFVANFPQTLQRTDIPGPHERLSTRRLLTYLPNVETIGEAVSFYFTFAFSPPYEPIIPLGGVHSELFYPGGPRAPRNRALIRFRNGLLGFMSRYQPDMRQTFQWPRDIET